MSIQSKKILKQKNISCVQEIFQEIFQNHTKCVFLNGQKCKTQPPNINLHPNEYTLGLHYYPFTVNLGGSVRSCNTLNDLFNKVCVLNKREDLNGFNMIPGINNINKTCIIRM